MEIGSLIDWLIGMPMVVLIGAVTLWWLFGRKDKGLCPKCQAPKIFGKKCINCGHVSVELDKK